MRLNEKVPYILLLLARRPHEVKIFYSGSKENLIQTQMLLLLELLLLLLLLLLYVFITWLSGGASRPRIST